MQAQGKLTGPPRDLMARRGPCEELYDTEKPIRTRSATSSTSTQPEHREALLRLRAALDTWIVETGDRGGMPEPPEVRSTFEKEMHDWFGTPPQFKTHKP